MLKVGFYRHFHGRWGATLRQTIFLIGFLVPAISAIAQPTIKTTPVDNGTYGTSYVYNIAIASWPNPVDFSLNSGAPGLSLTDNGDNTAVLSGVPTAAGTYTIIIQVNDPSDSQASTQSFDLVVDKAPLTVKADDATKVYGQANPPFTFQYISGFKFTDGPGVITSPPTASSAATNSTGVGTTAINVSGGSDQNYSFVYQPGTLTITKANLTISADSKTKVYGAAMPLYTYSYSGLTGGDTPSSIGGSLTTTTSASPTSPVGSYTLTPSGATSLNYNITFSDGTLNVTKAPLTISADAKSKVYGTANPAFTFSYSGFIGSDGPGSLTGTLTATTSATTTSPVNTYAITPSGVSSPNYNITFTDGVLSVTKAPLTITADAKSKVYGAALPTFTFSYSAFVGSDTPASLTGTLVGTTSATTTSPVNTYNITPSGVTSPNYNITFIDGTLTVTKASLTITADPKSKVYGAALPTFTFSYSSFIGSDGPGSLTGTLTATTSATATSPVNTYPITPSGVTSPNYNITFVDGVLSVTKAPLTITADAKSKVYGTANPAFTFSFTGFIGSDGPGSLTGTLTATTTATTTSPVNTYPITPSGVTSPNYNITFADGVLSVTKAMLTITADSKTKVYGAANPAFTFTYSGFAGSDSPSSLTTQPSGTTTAGQLVVGSYPITPSGAVSPNYDFTYLNGTLTVTKATLTITADPKSKVYGAANPPFTFSYSGFVSPDVAASLTTQPTATTTAGSLAVGTYPITPGGAASPNYDFNYVNGVLTVTKATLTVTADDASRVYGATNPAFTVSYAGFVGSDNTGSLTTLPTAGTSADVNSNVGSYVITPSGGVASNYTFSYVNGSLTITKAALTITADNKTRVYNTANPTFTLSYAGFKNSDNAASITPPTASTNATTSFPVGDYTIGLSGGSATNYSFTLVPGTLTITKATPVVTWNTPSAITYGTVLSSTQLNATANVGGDFTYTPASGTLLTAGSHTLSVNFAPSDATNYNPVNNTTVTLVVNKATPSITWSNPAAITYGTALNTTNHLNATASVPGSFAYSPAAGTVLNAGAGQTLSTTFTPTDAANYNTASKSVTITVNKATPTVTWNNPAAITYGTPLSSTQLNATFSVPGAATYVPGAGTILPAGANQVISVNFTPTDAVNYNSLSNVQVLITVNKATPVITWADPADISYGTALSSTQLNASSTTAGSFAYNPAAGTVLPSGAGQTLSTTFTPTDAANYNSASKSVTINVNKANPVITWPNPSAITYGTALSATQLNASTSTPGTFVYNPVAGTVLNAGSQALSATFTPTDPANYNTIITNKTLTVNKANPVITWSAPSSIVYGTPLTSTQLNASANVQGTFDYTPAAGTVLNVGSNQTLSVKFTPNDVTNYNVINATTTTITVTKATPVVTWNTPLPIKVGVALSSTQLNATASVPGSFVYSPSAGTSFSTEGSYTLHAAFTPSDQTNYNSVPDTQVQITVSSKDNPTVTWNAPSSITYGTALSSTQLNATASVPGSFSYSPATGTILNAGAGQTLTVTFTPTDQVNYNTVNKSVSINVNKATLTASAANASRAYGASNPTFVINYSGFVNGDDATVIDTPPTATSAASATSVAGTTFPIIPSAGADNNYSFSYTNGTLTINKAPLIATADNKTRSYGISNPPFTISYSGFQNGDTESSITQPTISSTATITSNVGDYAITLTGGSAANYTITRQAGTLTITKALLVVIGNDLTRPYGDPNPALTYKYTGFKNGETESVVTVPPTASTTATQTSPVGTYTVSVTGGSATNYSIQTFDGSLTIEKASLIAKADNKTKVYGTSNPANSITYTGFKNSDNAGSITPPTISGPAATTTSPAGTYPIQLSGGSASNYDLTLQNGTLTITKAPLTAKADNQTRQYGVANPTFTITYTGFVNGDDATDITPPSVTTTGTITADVGTYPITLSGGDATNYTFTLQPGTLTITPAPLTAKANDRTRTYGQSPGTLTITYTGFLNGDDATDITPPTASTTATSTSTVGTYPITLTGGSATNYTLTLQPGVLTIAKRLLTVKADDKTRPYGSANPANSLTYDGFVNGDNAGNITPPTITGPAATVTSNAGTYPITLSGGSAANYTLDLQNGVLTITKVVLTAKADNKSKTYGAANPALTITYTGFVNGQNISAINSQPTATTTATALSNVGTYTITPAGGADDNYTFSFTPGTLTINKATITATADNKTTTYGTIPDLTITYNGFVNGETVSVLDTKPVAATSATITSDPGVYDITVTGGTDNNYTFTNTNGTLTIDKAPLTIIADSKSRVVSLPNPTLTITYVGFKNGETESVLDVKPSISTTAVTSSAPGTYPITVTGGSDDHYTFTHINGTLTVILDNAPVAKDFIVETDEDVVLNFPLSIFETNRTDDPNGQIFKVKIVTLPLNGVLFKGATRAVAGDEISVENGQLTTPLTYQPNSNYSGNDSFQWNLFDGSFYSVNNGTITIKVLPVNDPPVLSNIEPGSLKYSLGDPPIIVSEQIIINDVDDNFIFSASILIGSNFTDGDQLSVKGGVPGTDIQMSYDPVSGELTLDGKATRAVYESLLKKVTFSSPVSGQATISEKNVTFVVRDSTANSNIASRKIDITEVFPELDIVNSFTPNGDNVNDAWDILNLEGYSTIDIFVFDPNGSKVFECHDPGCVWDGTNKGVALPAGPYMYTIDVNNGKRQYKGTVNILK